MVVIVFQAIGQVSGLSVARNFLIFYFWPEDPRLRVTRALHRGQDFS